jgi:hypothetical protein
MEDITKGVHLVGYPAATQKDIFGAQGQAEGF